jgi:SAM-dependent methyltransferase
MEPSPPIKLYNELAPWFHLLTAPEDYAEEAEFYRKTIISASDRKPETLLELGSGGGNNASYLKAHFQLTLVDLSPEMLAISRVINPECEHIQGDMRQVRLGRQFDVVFIHDAIMYLTSEEELNQAIKTAFLHCRPGGVALLAPDHVSETFRPSTEHGGHDGDRRGIRYLDWTWDPSPDDTHYISDMVYLLKDKRGNVQIEHDRHLMGLFPRQTWLTLLTQAGFQSQSIPFEHSEFEPGTLEVFVGRKIVGKNQKKKGINYD